MKLFLWPVLVAVSLMVSSCDEHSPGTDEPSGRTGTPQQSSAGNNQQSPVVQQPGTTPAQTNGNGPTIENPPDEPVVTIEYKQLPVKNVGREGWASCWAASGEMLMHYIGSIEARQCVQAQKLRSLAESACCKENGRLKAGSECDRDGYPDFDDWGFTFKSSATPLSWDDAVKEIEENRPFGFAGVQNNVAHMMVVYGYKKAGTNRQLYVLDPFGFSTGDPPLPAGDTEMSYSDYEGNGSFQNVTNFYGIKLKSSPQ